MASVEIIVIGNEILLGAVQDTNSSYLCRVVRARGGAVRRTAVVRDEINAISDEVKAAVERGPRLILTCGGLGPTADDLTLEAVAHAAGSRLVTDPRARSFVEDRYRALHARGYVQHAELDEARLKMARLPEGSRMIDNPVGTAPAMVLDLKGARVVALPGVPAELKAIVEGPLKAVLEETLGPGSYCEREIIVDCADESRLAPLLREVGTRHPAVYVKSRASGFGPEVKFRVLVSAAAATAGEATRLVELASGDLTSLLQGAAIEQAKS